MKLDFEKYLEANTFSEEAISIIDEGIQCYKVGAYRASFLMSYYFFLKVLKDRLEQSRHTKPESVDLSTWQGILRKINDDTVWDQTVFETTQWKIKEDGRSRIYLINNDLREDMVYWRRKRNDCAHSKDNIISYPHIESFWLFLESNLNKFIVNGGREALLEKFNIHFDPKYTKPGSSYEHLIQPIPLVVRKGKVGDLLKDIDRILEEKASYNYIEDEESIYYSFWKDIASSEHQDINKGFIDFITFDEEIFIKFITVYPEKLMLCTQNKKLVRNLWREKLFSRKAKGSNSYWDLAISLLRNKIVDDSEIEQFIRKLAMSGQYHKMRDEHLDFFKKYCFFEKIKEYLFEGDLFTQPYNGYNNANSNARFIMFYLENESLDEVVVSSLNDLFKGLKFGEFYDRFIKYLESNIEFKNTFIKIAEDKSLTLASIFTKNRNESEND